MCEACVIITGVAAVCAAVSRYTKTKKSHIYGDERLSESSDCVVTGKLKKIYGNITEKGMEYSLAQFEVYECLKGDIEKGDCIKFLTLVIEGRQGFKNGETMLLFLRIYSGSKLHDAYEVTGLHKGIYRIIGKELIGAWTGNRYDKHEAMKALKTICQNNYDCCSDSSGAEAIISPSSP